MWEMYHIKRKIIGNVVTRKYENSNENRFTKDEASEKDKDKDNDIDKDEDNKKVTSMKKDKKREGLIEKLKTSCGKCMT